MNNFTPIKALGFYCVLALGSASVQAATLQEVYAQALQNDHEFRAAAATYDANKEFKNIGRSALLPQVDLQGSWSETNGEYKLLDTEYEEEEVAYSANLNQALVDLSAWHGYQSGKALASAAEAQFTNAEQALVIRTASAYFDALQAVDNLATAEAEEEALKHQLEQTKQRFEVGLTAITDVHEAQAAYDSSTANRLVADGQLGIAFEALEVITGRTYTQLSPLKETFPVTPPEPLDRSEWEAFALENNASLKQAFFTAESSEAESKSRKSQHLPTLYGSLGYSNRDYETDYIGARNSHRDGKTVQLVLSVPIYSGGSTSAYRRQAYAQYVSDKEIYLKTKRDTIQAVRSTHLAVLTAAATVKARMQAITSNQSALEATQAGYDVGTRDLVDVLNAQRNLYTAQRDYYNALYTYVMSTLELRQAAGILSGEAVARLDQWLDKDDPVIYRRD